MRSITRQALKVAYFMLPAGIGLVLWCYIYGPGVNETTVMGGVAFVREMPYGEQVMGWLETTIFSSNEGGQLREHVEQNPGIRLSPLVVKQRQQLYR